MASVIHLRPCYNQAGAQRLLAEVEAAVTSGADLGDRRAVIGELIQDLHRNFARLQNAVVELRAIGTDDSPENTHMIRVSEEICADVLTRLGSLLKQADHFNALLVGQTTPATSPN